MKRGLLLGVLLSLLIPNAWAGRECVVMVHGMWRTHSSMSKLASYLREEGYYVINEDYPTNSNTIRQISSSYVPRWVKQCQKFGTTKTHFVTHSIGGLVVRDYLSRNRVPSGSRVVMLGPPNHGSVLADKMQNVPGYSSVMGPMGSELQTGKNGYAWKLPRRMRVDVGVITGDSSLNPIASGMMNGRNDGKVSVKSARLAGMKDFMVVHSSHTFIMRSSTVIRNVVNFLKRGHFSK